MANETENPVENTEKPALTPAPAVKDNTMPGAFELFKPSMEIIKRNLTAFLVLLGLPTLLILIGNGPSMMSGGGLTVQSDPANAVNPLFTAIGLIGLIFCLLATPGAILLQLKGARGEHIEMGQAFTKGLHYFWKMFGLGICLVVIFAVSVLLLIVPFFFALRRYLLAPYYLIDRDLGVFESLKVSAQESQGKWGAIYGVVGVLVLLSLVNVIPFIGWIASSVLSFLYANATALRYLHIKAEKEGKTPLLTPIEIELNKPAA